MRKVIYIGGTSYAGTTFFDMILANDPKGFSCGEVSAIFRPFRFKHLKTMNNEFSSQKIWKEVLKSGEKKLYETIFSLNPNIEFIIDSSKNPFWIRDQVNNLKQKQIKTIVLLLWKTPQEAYASFYKRNRENKFPKNWINYHRLFFSVIDRFSTVKYFDLVNNLETLKTVCKIADMNWNYNKYEYWNKKHDTLFGNTTAKIHLKGLSTSKYLDMKKYLVDRTNLDENDLKHNYQRIYYSQTDYRSIKHDVLKEIKYNEKIHSIIQLLEEKNILQANGSKNWGYVNKLNELKFGYTKVILKQLKSRLFSATLKKLTYSF